MKRERTSSPELRCYWEKQIKAWQQSGKTGISWCLDEQQPYGQFNYWKKMIVPSSLNNGSSKLEESSFIELASANMSSQKATSIRIEYGKINVYIDQYFDEKELRKVLRIVKELCPC